MAELSALRANIKEKGELSYYYAHKPREMAHSGETTVVEGPGIITGGTPVLLTTQKSDVKKEDVPCNVKLTKYMFDDKKKEVKVYIDLEDPVFNGEEFKES